MISPLQRRVLWIGGAVAAVAVGFAAWTLWKPSGPGPGFVRGNGRLEATEIDVATRLSGRVIQIFVEEGDSVVAGQAVAQMQVDVLEAQRDEAAAQSRHAIQTVTSARAQVVARQSDKLAAEAAVGVRESELDAAQRRLTRTESLTRQGAAPLQEVDDDRARMRGAGAALAGARAQVAAAQAAIEAAQAQVVGAGSSVTASEATIARVQADLRDCRLQAPRDARVQYRVAQPGEVLASGGKVLNLVDLSDVYLTFFLPETAVGKVALGSEVHLILDAVPQYVIPAQVSYVSSTAQFTPKTVETASERQKLMFRVKAQLGRDLLLKHRSLVKTGLPGVAWLKLDPKAEWPPNLRLKVPE